MYPPQYSNYPPPSAPPPVYNHGYPPPPPHGKYVTNVSAQTTVNGQWSTGLCHCGSNVSICCLTCWCPCITFGRIAEVVDRGTTSRGVHGALYAVIALLTGCGFIYSCMYRTEMRGQYGLPESPCNDCLVHCCCEACALCQEYRELENRGFDMSLGYQDSAPRQNGGVVMSPMVPGGMNR